MANTEEETLEDVSLCYSTGGLLLTDMLQRLKAALWFSVGKIVDEETLKMGVNATPQFIGALTELLWAQIGRSDRCIPARQRGLTSRTRHRQRGSMCFCKASRSEFNDSAPADEGIDSRHAGRKTITTDDVLLLSRRNEELAKVLRNFLDRQQSSKAKAPKR